MRLEAYQNQLNAMVRQQEMLRLTHADHLRARATLEEMDRMDPGREMLLPVGGDTFIRASPQGLDKVLIGLGSGVVVEIERAKGLELVNARILRLEKSEDQLGGQMKKLEEQATLLQQRLQAASEASDNAEGLRPDGPDVGAP